MGHYLEIEFEKLSTFKPMINVRYQLKLRNSEEVPYCHEDIGKDGKPFKSYAVEITMIKKGDLDKNVKVGQNYTFWMNAAIKCPNWKNSGKDSNKPPAQERH